MDELDTSNCETEPLRFPAAIQPHGALLVLHAASGKIEAASSTCEAFLGAAAESLLGRPLGQIFGHATQGALLGAPCAGLQPLVRVSLHGRELRARPNLNQAGQVLVDIEAESDDFSTMRGTGYHRRQVLTRLRQLSEIPAIAHQAAELIRSMTGYDRIMLYRFDPEWNGEVIGEARIDGITPYLGLNFPATDIPQQARELLSSSAVRLIPDALYTPSALISRGGQPIDLGASSLRSVSPTHIEYLRNMEVRATLVGSLIVEGRLWGLVSCQQKSGPMYFGPSVRDALGWMFEDFAALIEATLVRLRRSREYGLGVRRRHLVEAVRNADLKALIHPAHSADLLAVVAADGFALIGKDSIQTTGSTPSADRIRTLQDRRRGCETTPTLFASSALARDLQLEDAGDSVAGAVFVSLRDDPQVTMIWFRRERHFSVHWGGDPERMRIADETGRFSPRKSFVEFTQAVTGQSLAWAPEELDSAAELGSLIEIEALREREAFAQSILNSGLRQLAVLDTQGVIVATNRAWSRLAAENSPLGSAADVVGMSYQRACEAVAGKPQGEEAAKAWQGIEAVLSKTLTDFALKYSCRMQGETRWFRLTAVPIRAPGEGAVAAHEDITDSVNTTLALAKATERAALAIHSGGVGIWDWTVDSDAMLWDPQMYRLYGMTPQDEFGGAARWLSHLHPDDRADASRVAAAALESGERFDTEFRVVWPDGSLHYLRGTGLVVRDAAGRASRIVGTNLDITEARRLAASLDDQRERLHVTLKSIGDAVITTDADGNIDFLNPVAQHLTGWQPHEAAGRPLQQVFRIAQHEGFRTLLTSRDGRELDIEESSASILDSAGLRFGVVLVFRDITERQAKDRELEQYRDHLEALVDERTAALDQANQAAAAVHRASIERLNAEREAKIQSSKLEAVGTLAAGIAHDFNNILASIVAYAELADDDLPQGSEAKNNVAKVISGSFRARDLVARILDFAREGPGGLVHVNAVLQVREALALLRASLRPSIELAFHSSITEERSTILADPTRIMQIVMNLCINAAHAMNDHGIIAISVDPASTIKDAPAQQVESVCITVADTGSGMTPAVMDRIFDPFFTTKAPGEGSGLGLSVVYGIVKNLGGVIQVRSSTVLASSGTQFQVFLPVALAA
jgi:PAS domain S-box-containing protein